MTRLHRFPGDNSVAVSLTFDVDAEAGWLGEGAEYERRLTILSEGRYGVVRGIPRILELLGRQHIPATFFVPGYTAEHHPGLVDRLLEAGHEVAHHGYLHLRSDKASAQSQADEIERGLEVFEQIGVPKPRGYRSTSWELTPETFELLVKFGFVYDSSCMGDDRPYIERWGDLQILEIPVHWSLDDWPRFGWNIDGGGNVADPDELRRTWIAEFESARAERRHTSFTMHPEVIGRPYRLAQLERVVEHIVASGDVWFARMDQVAEYAAPSLGVAVKSQP
ncbi:polysaccharide deacetylase [Mycobacterium saskatchewanense]|uniref:Polysaccharide deacetylase n=1 Tax=Mycobacterium saskatchewanense TaxID=220927 RepID=A0AAJ3NRZ4_9MYCO|nr:polysaccharide deacetylase [Mycobacterium saskatchewanense]BBX63901.1 polysaccharide deacetylase [Mycobacterium saskatchewanense]